MYNWLNQKPLLPSPFIVRVEYCISFICLQPLFSLFFLLAIFFAKFLLAICRYCNDDESSALTVGLAKLLFPMEAKVAMDIAQVEGTSEFPSAGMISKVMSDAQRTTVDLNDAPFKLKEEHLNRLRALSKTGNDQFQFFITCTLEQLSYSRRFLLETCTVPW